MYDESISFHKEMTSRIRVFPSSGVGARFAGFWVDAANDAVICSSKLWESEWKKRERLIEQNPVEQLAYERFEWVARSSYRPLPGGGSG